MPRFDPQCSHCQESERQRNERARDAASRGVDVLAVEIIDDMEDAASNANIDFDWKLFSRARDFILDITLRNQRLLAALEVAWEEGAKTAWARSTVDVNGQRYLWRTAGAPLNPYAGAQVPEYPMLGEGDSCPVDHSKADCPWHRTVKR